MSDGDGKQVLRLKLVGEGNADFRLTLFLPSEGGKFDSERLAGDWPAVTGHWDVPAVGEVSYDDDELAIIVNWSDGDLTETRLRPGTELTPGRILTFSSPRQRYKVNFVVEEVARL